MNIQWELLTSNTTIHSIISGLYLSVFYGYFDYFYDHEFIGMLRLVVFFLHVIFFFLGNINLLEVQIIQMCIIFSNKVFAVRFDVNELVIQLLTHGKKS